MTREQKENLTLIALAAICPSAGWLKKKDPVVQADVEDRLSKAGAWEVDPGSRQIVKWFEDSACSTTR